MALQVKDPSAAGGRASVTHRSLLDAAEQVIASVGFDALTSTAVAAHAGVATGSFYRYFADKYELLAALFADRLDAVLDAVEAELTADNLLDNGLQTTLAGAVDTVVEGYRAHAAVLHAALALVPTNAACKHVYWGRHDRALATIERFLRRGAAAGMIRDDDHPTRAAAVLVMTEGLNHPLLVAGDGTERTGLRAALTAAMASLLAPDGG